MQAYYITYTVRGNEKEYSVSVDARDAKSAKKKIGKNHGYKDGRMIQTKDIKIIGYY